MKKIIVSLFMFTMLIVPGLALAQDGKVVNPAGTGPDGKVVDNQGAKTGLQITLTNPLKADNLEGFVSSVLSTLLKFVIPILAVLFIYTGFEMVMARGNKDEWKKTKTKFFNLVIGAVLILGAWTFGNVIMNTLKDVGIIK